MSIINYSTQTPAQLQAAQLAAVAAQNPNLDTREGSLIQTAIGPASQVVGGAYVDMQAIETGAFALTACGAQLDMLAAGAGVTRNPSTACVSTIAITTTTTPFTPSSLLPAPAGPLSSPMRFATNTGANSVVFDLNGVLSPCTGTTLPAGTWPTTSGGTVIDNNILWTYNGTASSLPAWSAGPVSVGTQIDVGGNAYIASIYSYPYTAVCETAGSVGATTANTSGAVIPLTSIAGLSGATIGGVLSGGTDPETDASLLSRYLVKVNLHPFGGNLVDYFLVLSGVNPLVDAMGNTTLLSGVGAVQIYPTWNGGGSVLCAIVDTDFNPATSGLIATIQHALDPVAGQGLGMAPIGAVVTVQAPTPLTINVSGNITVGAGISRAGTATLCQNAVESCFAQVAQTWGTSAAYNPTFSYGSSVIAARQIVAMLNLGNGTTTVLNVTNLQMSGGKTEATAPSWPTTIGQTVTDGNFTWLCSGTDSGVSNTWAALTDYVAGSDHILKPMTANGYSYTLQPDLLLIETPLLQQLPLLGTFTPTMTGGVA